MRILNFGSLNIDYVYHVDHFVRAGETLGSTQLETFCGGKGLNQSVALARAGAEVWHAGKIGSGGEMLTGLLKSANVHTEFIKKSDQSSGHAIIQVDPAGQNCILLYPGANHDLDEDMIDEVLGNFEAGDILLLQNETNRVDTLMQKAAAKGMPVAFNPSPFDDALRSYPLRCVRFFILNEIESEGLTGLANPQTAANRLLELSPGSSALITLGAKGCYYKDADTELSLPAYDVPVVDTTAAGDTFTGYFLAGLAQGLLPKVNLWRATIAAAIAVSRKGASSSIPTAEEINRLR